MRAVAVLAPLGAIALVLACSDQGTVGPIVFASCLRGGLAMGGQQRCADCVEASCGQEGQTFEAACTDYLSCACPDGQAGNSASVARCASKLSETSCAQALGAIETCQQRNCGGPCAVPGTDSGPDARPGNDAGSGTVTFSCTNGAGTMAQCDQQHLAASAVEAAQQGCVQVGGTTGTGCPTQGLSGCCNLSTTEACYYDPASTTQRQATCQSAGGAWSTTP